jgi:NTP pyrophosphatase (non-canonical NTP hydrolase)
MDIRQYQIAAHKTAITDDLDVFVFGLIGEAGEIASAVKQAKRESSSRELLVRRVSEEIGDLIWYASEIATAFDINLLEALQTNLQKASDLFENREADFDTSSLPEERFPAKGVFRFEPVGERVRVTLNGKEFGDPLDDNSHREDGYRFHDVFHIANMVLLGWSPVMRKLLGCKRRKGHDDNTDRVEDGARSAFLEEGITALVFSQSDQSGGVSLFADSDTIPFALINTIKRMTSGLEVRARSVTMWRNAISTGFEMFDLLSTHEGGEVQFDMKKKSLKFKKIK